MWTWWPSTATGRWTSRAIGSRQGRLPAQLGEHRRELLEVTAPVRDCSDHASDRGSHRIRIGWGPGPAADPRAESDHQLALDRFDESVAVPRSHRLRSLDDHRRDDPLDLRELDLVELWIDVDPPEVWLDHRPRLPAGDLRYDERVDPMLGNQVGRYRIDRKLGQGGLVTPLSGETKVVDDDMECPL